MDKYSDITQYKTAGFVRRWIAHDLDILVSVLIGILFLGILTVVSKNLITQALASLMFISGYGMLSPALVSLVFLLVSATLVFSVLMFFFRWFFTYKFGGTLGKLMMGMRVVNDGGGFLTKKTAFWRMTAGYGASSTFLLLGYFWILKKENLGWHDKFFGTKVITVGKPVAGILASFLLPILIASLFYLLVLSNLSVPMRI